MLNRIRKPPVAMVRTLEEIKRISIHPAIDVRGREPTPLEWPARLSLAQAINVNRVVAGCSAKAVSFTSRADIHTCSRIDEYAMSTYRQVDTQAICVAVSVAASLSRTSINHKLLTLCCRAGHHMNSAALKCE